MLVKTFPFSNNAARGFDFEGLGVFGYFRVELQGRRRRSFKLGKISKTSRTWRLRVSLGRFTLYATPDVECATHL